MFYAVEHVTVLQALNDGTTSAMENDIMVRLTGELHFMGIPDEYCSPSRDLQCSKYFGLRSRISHIIYNR